MGESKRPWWMPETSMSKYGWEAHTALRDIQYREEDGMSSVVEEVEDNKDIAFDAEAMPAYEGSRSIKEIYSRSELEWFAEYILEYRWRMLLAETDMVVEVMSEDVLDFLSRHPRHEVRLLVAECRNATVGALGRLTQDKNSEVAEAALLALAERRNK